MDVVLAVDIGGTKLAAGIVDRTGHLLSRSQVPTPSDDAASMGEALLGLVTGELAAAPGEVIACGVGSGGPMSFGGETVSPLNIPAWRGFPLRRAIAEGTGLRTWVDNDAKALALGEGWVGAAAEVDDYLAMVVSTGVGGGIVLDGRLLDGNAGNAGHIGHVVAVPDGRVCGCGARGCLEAEASGTAIAEITGAPAAEADHATRRRTGTLVGRVVGSVANLLDLRLVVVAGSVALGYGETFFEAANEELSRVCRIEHSKGAVIVPAGLGDAGPLIGAAAVAFRGMSESPANWKGNRP